MGSRGRSIRLRIYFLVAIPLITMLGLFGYVAYTSITNWLNLDRAPVIIRETSIPITNFVTFLQNERRAAIVYESQPSAANLAAYQSAVTATKNNLGAFEAVVNSSATTQNATPAETAALTKMVTDVTNMSGLRAEVSAKKLSTIDTFEAYSEIVADQNNIFVAQSNSMTQTTASAQGLGLISAVLAREDLSEQDAVLAGALVANSLTGTDRAAFSQAAGRQFDDTQLYQHLLTAGELQLFNTTMNQLAPPATIQANLTKVQNAVEADIPLAAMEQQGLSPATWQLLTSTWQKANYQATTNTAGLTLNTVTQIAADAKNRVWETAGAGALGLILTVLVSLLLSRSINGRLATLRRSALTLAQEQLPSVVGRLRRGESVDVAVEAPPLRVGDDEIGQVGQAIDTVRQTAIRSAIDESRVRQGVNDMFRNLARRNQSLLQRQLSVLDGMERRATDPDVLEDLFKMDHLTTRMRRHAEGLIILSGAPPGRSWSAPVKLVDVMRGAVAEVEDYARVTVSTQSRAALAGSAVTDVIHLLAELIENATSLSPPFTQVRVGGETVANGFAIEIEDRGLGMAPQRLQELNERLSNPPDINPANTEQLGLFVVGQLARRHGVRVMLRPSPYGGTTAIVLIPLALVVEDGPAAITSGGRAPATSGASNGSGNANGSSNGGGYANGAAGARTGGARGAATRSGGNGTASRPAAAAYNGGGTPSPGAGYPSPGAADPREHASGSSGYGTGSQDPSRSAVRITSAQPNLEGTGSFGTTGGYSRGGTGTAPKSAEPGARRGRHGTDEVPVVTGVPVGRSPATPLPEFDVFTPIRRDEQDGSAAADTAYPYPDFGGPSAVEPHVSPYSDVPGGSAYRGDGAHQDNGARGGNGQIPGAAGTYGDTETHGNEVASGNNGDSAGSPGNGESAGSGLGDINGLPRRIRQANLAPQLRASAAAGPQKSPGVPAASAASLTDMRNTLSAMQRGWQQGRSQTQKDTED
jgi:signal transduction histidine kinase